MGKTVKFTPRRGGLDVITLETLLSTEIPEREALLGTWLKQRHLNMTYAQTGVGKSMFSMSIAIAVAGGGEYLGWQATKPRSVLVVDGEMDLSDLKERARVLLSSIDGIDLNEASSNLHIMAQQGQQEGIEFPDIAKDEDHDKFLAIAKAVNAELVILDNYSTLATVDDENAANSFDPVLRLLVKMRQAGLAVMLIHHSRKNANGDQAYRGTSKMGVLFNSIIKLDAVKTGRTQGRTAFNIHWEKFRGLRDKTILPLQVALEAKDDGAQEWTYEMSTDAHIEEMLGLLETCEYPTDKALADALDWPTMTLSRRKWTAIKNGRITEDLWNNFQRGATGEPDEDF